MVGMKSFLQFKIMAFVYGLSAHAHTPTGLHTEQCDKISKELVVMKKLKKTKDKKLLVSMICN